MAQPTVRIISRYLLAQHVAPLAFALTALTSLMLLNQVAKQFSSLVGKGLPGTVILEVFVLSVPFIVAVTLPMAVLVAVLYTVSHLAADNEITALRAGGVSGGRLLAPVLGGAAFISVLAFLWSDQVLPRTNHRLRSLLVDIQRKKPSFTLREQVINEVVPQRFFLRAARIDQASNRLRDVEIHDLEDAERRRIIRADSGHMAYTPGGTDLYLTLYDGEIQEVKRADPSQFSRTFYRTNLIRVAGIGNQFTQTGSSDSYRSDREMTICQMDEVVRRARADEARARGSARLAVANDLRRLAGVAPLGVDADSATLAPPGVWCGALDRIAGWLTPDSAMAQTPAADSARRRVRPPIGLRTPGAEAAGLDDQTRVRAARQRAAIYEVEIQKKLAIAAACLVFALVGLPLGLRFPRGGVGLVIGTSLTVFTIYYIGLIGGEELGDRLIVSPFLAMWAPNLVFTVLGLLGLAAVRRESGTARGGDWNDLRDLFLLLRRRRT